MRSDPEGRELCRLSAGYGHKDACGRVGAVLNDPNGSAAYSAAVGGRPDMSQAFHFDSVDTTKNEHQSFAHGLARFRDVFFW